MRKLVGFVVAASLVAGGGGEGHGRHAFGGPVVTLRDVRLNGLGLTGGSLDVVLGVYNPNGFRLDATRLTYRVVGDSFNLATGALDSPFTVAQGDQTTVRMPVSFTYGGLGQAGRELLNTGTLNYRVIGDVTVATPVGSFTVPYDRTGRYTALGGTSR